ncbi:MAG TPA: ABC transporter permease subunit [Pirellulales bacterium]|jgi:phosphate transport system permease protein|nr:ABC transporter permease subunit [Pirellulales bacterium]
MVTAGDRVARSLVAVGGIGTIGAVLLVCVFLASQVIPLFLPAKVESTRELPGAIDAAAPANATGTKPANFSEPPIRLGIDEFGSLAWALFADGRVRSFRLDNGHVLDNLSPRQTGLAGMTAVALATDGQRAVFGFRDGKLQTGRIGFETRFVDPPDVPAVVREMAVGATAEWDGGLVARTPTGQYRRQKLVVKLDDPIEPGEGKAAVQLVDQVEPASGSVFCWFTESEKAADHSRTAGVLRIASVETRHDLLAGEDVSTLSTPVEVALPADIDGPPKFLRLGGLGEYLYIAWSNGRLLRYETRDLDHPRLMEDRNLLGESGMTLTALAPLLGGTTFLAGDSSGRVRTWFPVQPPEARKFGSGQKAGHTQDTTRLIDGPRFPAEGSPVACIASSSSDREAAVGFGDGRTRLLFITTEKTILDLRAEAPAPVESVAISPKGDRLLAVSGARATVWKFDPGYPDGSFSALFLPVWYEGEPAPKQIWQTSGGSGFEPKLGLMPLVFGTFKATFYSMIFAAPLALLAALFTSEFLHPRTKARIKPTVELMASLPSVVLGFLAGLVVAPIVSGIVPEVLAGLVTVPLALLAGAYVWQLLPHGLTLRFARWRFAAMLLLAIPAGVVAAAALGPLVQTYLFDGDIKAWLTGRLGSGLPGWIMLLLPFTALLVAVLINRTIDPWLRGISASWSRTRSAVAELLKFIFGIAATVVLVFGVAWILDAVKIDPRGTFVGRYDERNALIVGLAMGFAIIPLIYTLADDALSSVPASLRSASLGAGATHWQTAMHVVIPTAMSGLFSAVMIGLGRAVGETMIILMAAGGQPLMDINIFNGFQTLSAAIATQMPEAAVGTTHLRTLYVAALALFIITFVVNTVAEVVRQRFRRRAYEL